MKLYGSLSRLVAVVFRKDAQDLTARPNQGTTYTAARDFQLPPGDADHVLVSANSTQALSNKTISGSANTITNVSLTAGVAGILPVANGGTNSNTTLNNNRVIQSAGGAIVEAAAITAARALISDSNGIPTHSAVTSTELGYSSGVTSALQTQLDGKQPLDSDLTALAAVSTNGVLVRTGAGTATTRTLTAGTGISISNGDGVAGNPTISATASTASFKATWLLIDGTSKSITHSLGSTDVIVQVFDIANGQTIEVDTVNRTDGNTVDLTASEAPGVSWRVLILAV